MANHTRLSQTLTSSRFGVRASLRAAVVTVAAFTLGGCPATNFNQITNFESGIGPAPNLPPAQLPVYQEGDKYYYTNGARDQVVNVQGEAVNMISRSGRKRTYFRNFALPPPYVEGYSGHYYKETNTSTSVLWPLRVGNSARFSTQGRAVNKKTGGVDTYMQRFECKVDGTERVRVMAGEFDTYRVECKRYSQSGYWWETTTWWYAPEVGTYVMRREFHKRRGERVRQLTAVRPSLDTMNEDARRNVILTWQSALEFNESGEAETWSDPQNDVTVEVVPLQTFQAQNGLFCRSYKQVLTRGGAPNAYRGVACRTDKLRWLTPARI